MSAAKLRFFLARCGLFAIVSLKFGNSPANAHLNKPLLKLRCRPLGRAQTRARSVASDMNPTTQAQAEATEILIFDSPVCRLAEDHMRPQTE